MLSQVQEAGVLVGAGIVAGTVGAAGAIASLISYPVLLAVGIPALPANIANSVAGVAIGLGSTPASREELQGSGRQLLRWSGIAAIGAAVGAALLLITPHGTFEWIVPFLVAGGSVILLLQPKIAARRVPGQSDERRRLLPAGLFGVAVYGGYFGAGSGIMMLTLLLFTVDGHLPRANAMKNVLLTVGGVVVAIGFTAFGSVQWAAAIPLGIGFLAGGAIGPSVARRVPAHKLRIWIAMAGFTLAAWLLIVAVGS
ncbi:MAG: sulfite exporter TauE/SafE family protein [Nakamurella sp.]